LYGEINHLHGLNAYTAKSGFPSAQAIMNIVESTLSLEYIYLVHLGGKSKRISKVSNAKRADPKAPLIGFAAAVMTLSKTLLYWLQGRRKKGGVCRLVNAAADSSAGSQNTFVIDVQSAITILRTYLFFGLYRL